MDLFQLWYLPRAPVFFVILFGFFVFVLILLPLGLLRYAYEQLGVSQATAVLLLFASLIGSYINIPIAVISQKSVMASQTIDFFGMRYQVPAATDWGGTVLAVNIGGALIPVIMSVYLLIRWQLWWEGLVATGIVAAVCYWPPPRFRGWESPYRHSHRQLQRPSFRSSYRAKALPRLPTSRDRLAL